MYQLCPCCTTEMVKIVDGDELPVCGYCVDQAHADYKGLSELDFVYEFEHANLDPEF
jgi:hypothetical protein